MDDLYYRRRLHSLKKLFGKSSIDALLVSSVPDIIYLTGFSYFSNIEREGFLVITNKSQYIITDGRYSQAVKTHIKDFELIELSAQNKLEDIIKKILENENIATLGIDEKSLSVFEYRKLSNVRTKHFGLSPLRKIKDEFEISRIQKACEIGDDAFSAITKFLKTGITEKEIESILEKIIKDKKAEFSFPAIVAFGENSAVPHHKTGHRKLKMDEFVLLDFGVKYENYCSDMTRTIFFGQANEEQRKVYEIVHGAQMASIDHFNNLSVDHLNSRHKEEWSNEKMNKLEVKVSASELDKAARDFITSKGFPSIPHSLGHGIGLEVHEAPSLSPKSKDALENGMVFSIEPGIYLPNKYGVRIEDLYVVQNYRLMSMMRSDKNFIEIS